MADARTDAIAREAARLLDQKKIRRVPEAIRLAAESLGLHDAPKPGAGRVRKHAQARTMQELGQEAYNDLRLKVWRIAEELMSALEHVLPDATTMLVGRTVDGHIDGGITIHIRIYTRDNDRTIAQTLVDLGYDEPQFRTANAQIGRLNQIAFSEEGTDIVLTLCRPDTPGPIEQDLFTNGRVSLLDLSCLRRTMSDAKEASGR